MKKILLASFLRVFGLLQSLAPSWAGRLAIFLFFRPGRKKCRVKEPDYFLQAQVQRRAFKGHYKRSKAQSFYTRYSWGSGPRTILLVHGWGGRASQFNAFLEPLLQAGFRVLSFDAPAHGDSPGSRTNLLEMGQIIEEISSSQGSLWGVISHSFGAVATGRAYSRRAELGRLVFLAAPARLDYILTSFAEQLRANTKTMDYIRTHLRGLATKSLDEFSLMELVKEAENEIYLLHDSQDERVAFSEFEELLRSCPQARSLVTDGLGHNRILSEQTVIDQIVEFLS